MKTRVLFLTVLLAIVGCAGLPEGFEGNPKPLASGQAIDPRMAIVLVGIMGPNAVDYLQFTHATFPAISSRFPARANTIVAIPISVGVKQLKLSTITFAGRPGFYIGSVPIGYVPVRSQSIDIDKPGIYYLVSLNTAKVADSGSDPKPEQLLYLRDTLGESLAGLQPINFKWHDK